MGDTKELAPVDAALGPFSGPSSAALNRTSNRGRVGEIRKQPLHRPRELPCRLTPQPKLPGRFECAIAGNIQGLLQILGALPRSVQQLLLARQIVAALDDVAQVSDVLRLSRSSSARRSSTS